MILGFPPRAANDNDEPEGWICVPCANGAFLLAMEGGETHIRCTNCGADVTASVLPTLSTKADQCHQ